MQPHGGRLRYIDGLRGIAIVMVMIWHFMGPTDAEMLPYGDRYASLPMVSSGWMGVELFFLISGFVIFMTVERCNGFRDFAMRRFQRLYPAMLIATVFLFAMDRLLGIEGPHGSARALDLLPGLSFISPAFWHAILNLPIKSLSNVFWTLYVECAFYLIFGVAFFKFGWKHALALIFGLFVLTQVAETIFPIVHAPRLIVRAFEPAEWLGFQFFGWFTSGALFFKAIQRNDTKIFALAIVTGLIAAFALKAGFPLSMAQHLQLMGIVALFAISHKSVAARKALDTRFLVFAGAISYPLYLIHSNMGVGLLAKGKTLSGLVSGEVVALAVVVVVVAFAWLIERFAEPWVKEQMRPVTGYMKQVLRLNPA